MTLIRVAHSPDSDDAFMFFALANGLIETGGYRFEHVLSDIETLNREARPGTYEVTAVPIHNDLTVDYGERGRAGMTAFLERAFASGLIPRVPRLDFI